MPSKVDFPKTMKEEMRFFDRRSIGERGSMTMIYPLLPDGSRGTQYDEKARLGVYFWNKEAGHWEFEDEYKSRSEARSAAARLRKNLI